VRAPALVDRITTPSRQARRCASPHRHDGTTGTVLSVLAMSRPGLGPCNGGAEQKKAALMAPPITQRRRTPGCEGSLSAKFTGPMPQMAMMAGSGCPRTTPS
jgi:hypothetical protein